MLFSYYTVKFVVALHKCDNDNSAICTILQPLGINYIIVFLAIKLFEDKDSYLSRRRHTVRTIEAVKTVRAQML